LDQLLGIDRAPTTLRAEELERLQHAATHGAPAVPHTHRGSPPLFEVRRADVRHVRGPRGELVLRVAPVSRLRMVMAQTGYQRLEPQTAQVVPTAFDWNGVTWYPGIRLIGEGIFVDVADGPPVLEGSRLDEWEARFTTSPLAE